MPVIPFPQQFPPGHIHSTMHQAGHTIRKVLSLLRQHLPENRGILAYRSELLIPLTYKTPHRDLIQTVYLSDQSLPQLTGRGCGIHVSATLRFSDDGVNHPQLPQIQRRQLQIFHKILSTRGVLVEYRRRSLWSYYREDAVLHHEHAVTGAERECSPRTSLSDNHRYGGSTQLTHSGERGSQAHCQSPLLRLIRGQGTRRIQQRYQGEPELLSPAHSPLSLPVPFRKHMATPAHRITVPAFLTHDHHRPTRSLGEAHDPVSYTHLTLPTNREV